MIHAQRKRLLVGGAHVFHPYLFLEWFYRLRTLQAMGLSTFLPSFSESALSS
ncbi:hypothetical protein FORC54_3136 [Vibrio vulnificus]|nr:hypothetical protein FORC54_3136 [Vibrio vulnificus]